MKDAAEPAATTAATPATPDKSDIANPVDKGGLLDLIASTMKSPEAAEKTRALAGGLKSTDTATEKTAVAKQAEKPAGKAAPPDPKTQAPGADKGDKSENWRKLNAALEERTKSLDEAKAQLADFEGTKKERDALKAEIESHKKQIAALSEIDSLAKLQNSPDFIKSHEEPRRQALEKLSELAGFDESLNVGDLLVAVSKSGKARFQALDTLLDAVSPSLRGKIEAQFDKIDAVEEARDKELANVGESLKARAEARERETVERRETDRKAKEQAWDKVSGRLKSELNLTEDQLATAKTFFTGNTSIEAAIERIIKSEVADGAISSRKELTDRIAELEGQLKGYRASDPGVRAGGGGNRGTTQTDPSRGGKGSAINATLDYLHREARKRCWSRSTFATKTRSLRSGWPNGWPTLEASKTTRC